MAGVVMRHVAAPLALFVVAAVATGVLVGEAVADPETVEGMYLEKRGDEAVLKRQKGPLALPEDEEDKARPPLARPTSPARPVKRISCENSGNENMFDKK